MSNDRIIFRGVQVSRGWPERLREAQLEITCRPNGVETPRIWYGGEPDWAHDRPCRDCAAIKGEYHVPGCDVERCPACGGQLWFGCACEWPDDDGE